MDLHRLLGRIGRRLIPKNRLGDKYATLQTFVSCHRRLPRRRQGNLNDAFFHVKTSDEILDPLRVFTTDKEYLKLYVKARLGDEFNVPTVAVLKSREAAAAFEYPQDCVLKPTHMSGQVMFRRDGSPVSYRTINWWFNSNYYLRTREANYRFLKPKLMIEPYIFDRTDPVDYKILCANGEPRLLWVDSNRSVGHQRSLYTPEWDYLPFAFSIEAAQGPELPKPANLTQMLDVARELSQDFNLIRVDLYTDESQIYVGELTNVSGNAKARFSSSEAERMLTSMIFGDGGFCRK